MNDSYARQYFIGVFPIDLLPSIDSFPCSFIFNTHTSNKPGEHWIGVFYDKKQNCSFFDSFGFSPKDYGVESYLKKIQLGIHGIKINFKIQTPQFVDFIVFIF